MTVFVNDNLTFVSDRISFLNDDVSINQTKLHLLSNGVLALAGSASFLTEVALHLGIPFALHQGTFEQLTVDEFVVAARQTYNSATSAFRTDWGGSYTTLNVTYNRKEQWANKHLKPFQLQLRKERIVLCEISEAQGNGSAYLNYAFDAHIMLCAFNSTSKHVVVEDEGLKSAVKGALISWLVDQCPSDSLSLDSMFEAYDADSHSIDGLSFDAAVRTIADIMWWNRVNDNPTFVKKMMLLGRVSCSRKGDI